MITRSRGLRTVLAVLALGLTLLFGVFFGVSRVLPIAMDMMETELDPISWTAVTLKPSLVLGAVKQSRLRLRWTGSAAPRLRQTSGSRSGQSMEDMTHVRAW